VELYTRTEDIFLLGRLVLAEPVYTESSGAIVRGVNENNWRGGG